MFVCSLVLLSPCETFLVFSTFYFQNLDHLYYHYSEFFSDRPPISSSFVRSGGFLACSFICCVFLCLLILLNLLCLGSPFCRLQVSSSHCFWCLPPLGKVGSVGCLVFLVEGTGACVLVDEVGSCLSGGPDASGGLFWGICELRMLLDSLSANGRGCVPVFLVFWHGVSGTGARLWLSGAWS